jgi:hypothetical protein
MTQMKWMTTVMPAKAGIPSLLGIAGQARNDGEKISSIRVIRVPFHSSIINPQSKIKKNGKKKAQKAQNLQKKAFIGFGWFIHFQTERKERHRRIARRGADSRRGNSRCKRYRHVRQGGQ